MADRGQSADFHEFGAAVGAGVVVDQQPATSENREFGLFAFELPSASAIPIASFVRAQMRSDLNSPGVAGRLRCIRIVSGKPRAAPPLI